MFKELTKPSSIDNAIRYAELLLQKGEIESPKLDAEYLIGHITGLSKFDLYMNMDELLDDVMLHEIARLVQKRVEGQPLQYLTGKAYFRDLVLEVSHDVLVPRPETELLVELVLAETKKRKPGQKLRIVDVGTGSGAIIISLAKEMKNQTYEFIATDISEEALSVAKKNAAACTDNKIEFLKTSLLDRIDGKIDIIIANLPYIPTGSLSELPADVQKEPDTALNGGILGYEIIEQLISDCAGKLRNGALLFLELGIGQHKHISRCMSENGFINVETQKDLSGIERFLIGEYFV